jgi:DNA-binding NarL/FixJ family response regulator
MRILVVSLDPLARRAVADLVGRMTGAEVVGEMEPGPAASFANERSAVDAIVWESHWDSQELRRLSELRGMGLLVVALAATAEQARRARAWGALAVLPRGVDAPALEAALSAVLEGLTVADPVLEPPPREPGGLDETTEELTPRDSKFLA